MKKFEITRVGSTVKKICDTFSFQFFFSLFPLSLSLFFLPSSSFCLVCLLGNMTRTRKKKIRTRKKNEKAKEKKRKEKKQFKVIVIISNCPSHPPSNGFHPALQSRKTRNSSRTQESYDESGQGVSD